MSCKAHAYDRTNDSDSSRPTLENGNKREPPKNEESNTNKKLTQPEKRWRGLTRFEWIMAILTLAGVVTAIFTGLIFWGQLKEMRRDQRAWVYVSGDAKYDFPRDEASLDHVQIVFTVNIQDTGKTAAQAVEGDFVMEYVTNGDAPEFSYRGLKTHISTGMISPNDPFPVRVPFTEGVLRSFDTSPRFLTPAEFRDLHNGNAYMAVYANITYRDIRGQDYWLHYCSWFAAPDATVTVTGAKACTDYNETDNN